MLSWVFLGDRAEIKRKSGAVNHDGKNHGSLHLMSMPCNTSNSSWISRSLQWKKTTANANLTDIGFPPKKNGHTWCRKGGKTPMHAKVSGMYARFFPGSAFWRLWVPKEAFGNLIQPAWCRTSKGKSNKGAIHLCRGNHDCSEQTEFNARFKKASSKKFRSFWTMESGTQHLMNPNLQAWSPTSSQMPMRRPAILGLREKLPIHQNCQSCLEICVSFKMKVDPSNSSMVSEEI